MNEAVRNTSPTTRHNRANPLMTVTSTNLLRNERDEASEEATRERSKSEVPSSQLYLLQQQVKEKEKEQKRHSASDIPLTGGTLISFDELMEFIKKIVSLSDSLKDSKLKKTGSVIHIRLLHIEVS